MPKSKRSSKQRNKSASKRGLDGQVGNSNGTITRSVPRPIRQVYRIRRAWVQQVTYAPSTGFAGAGPNLSMYFSAGTSEVFINGVSVYTPVLPNSTEFSNLFDDFRIAMVHLRLDWSTGYADPSQVLQAPPLLYAAIDYDDNNNAAVADLIQYPGCVNHTFVQNGYTPFVMNFKPLPLKDVAGVGIVTAYSPDRSNSYLRTTNLSVPYYGVKIATSNMGATSVATTGVLQISAYVDLEFINPK